jgi:hypothetical protein
VQEDYAATLVLRRSTAPLKTPTPDGLTPAPCAGVTAADAQAILGEPVEPERRSAVKIQVPADDETFVESKGLCGFVSVAKNTNDVRRRNEPYEMTYSSHAAVTAERLTGARAMELVRVAAIIQFANPDADATPFLLIKTRLAAGDWNGLFGDFADLAGGTPEVTVEPVDSFGDEGLWLWRSGEERNYAALLVREGDSFVILEALLNQSMTQAAANEAMRAVMGR